MFYRWSGWTLTDKSWLAAEYGKQGDCWQDDLRTGFADNFADIYEGCRITLWCNRCFVATARVANHFIQCASPIRSRR